MNKGLFISVLTLLNFTSATYAAPTTQSLSPYDVVVPSLNGDPATGDRVSGQLYYDVSTSDFKGIDNTGTARTLLTSTPWISSGDNIYFTGGKVGIGGAPGGVSDDGLDIQTASSGTNGLIIRTGTTGTKGAVVFKPDFTTDVLNIQGTNSALNQFSTQPSQHSCN